MFWSATAAASLFTWILLPASRFNRALPRHGDAPMTQAAPPTVTPATDPASPPADGAPAYVSEGKIYPRECSRPLQRCASRGRRGCWACSTCFPWLRWDGRQAVLFDLPARKFHVFGLTFWPQDFVFLALLLIIAALALFFFTALAGRLWCGYACPQTVWTEVFLWMERWTEGDRASG
jgi:hypothetical protein